MLEYLGMIGLIVIGAGLVAEALVNDRRYRRRSRQLKAIEKSLARIEALLQPEEKAVTFEFYELINGQYVRVENMVQSIEETKKYKIMARDKAGNEAKLDGMPALTLTDAALADIVIAEDGSFDIAPKGPVGECKLQVVADADLGEGVEELFGEADFVFVAGKAVSIEIVPA